MIGVLVATVGIAVLGLGCMAFLTYPYRWQNQPERTSPGDWFQTLPLADFLPTVPRLPSVRRLVAPKRRGRHVA